VTVVGSLNLDRSLYVHRLPPPGATVHARDELLGPGGKGANQAVAAARVGASVRLVGAVGDDDAGRLLRAEMATAGVAVSDLRVVDAPTGSATIVVADDGENQIVVLEGANGALRFDADTCPTSVVDTDVLLLQLETPLATQLVAARATRATVILNPAPMPDPASLTALLAEVDVLVPNRTELAALVGLPADVADTPLLAAAQHQVIGTTVVTLGAAGAAIVTPDDVVRVAARPVAAVDATGAGDTFCGVLAAGLAAGQQLPAAVETAVHAASITVTRRGAQRSFPTHDELLAQGGSTW